MPYASHQKPVVAYSYIRFSTREQLKGDSLRRQSELADAYCRRRGWTLDANLTLRDLGVSAFRGDNALVGNLGVFLDAIKNGKVRPGSALIVESIDRISRQGIDEGYELCKRIIKAGILLVTLSPEREFGPEAVKSLSKGALEMQLILERAAEESERKSERVGAAWREKRERARRGELQKPTERMGSNCKVLTHQLPAWMVLRDGVPVLVRDKATTLRRIFRMAANGYGCLLIAKTLIDEGVPPFIDKFKRRGQEKEGQWTASYIAQLFTDRRVIGEFQPRTRDGKPAGDPIPGYFPAALTEEQFLAARASIASRRSKPGRIGNQVGLFTGLLKNALDGDNYYAANQPPSKGRGKPRRVFINAAYREGQAVCRTFPEETFERAVLSAMREIDPRKLLANDTDGPDEADVLEGQIDRIDAELADAAAFMDANGFSTTIGKRIADLEARRQELTEKLTAARQNAAAPVSESWGTLTSLLDVLDKAPDQRDTRLRLRAALRRIVDQMYMLVVPRGRDRLAAVQVWFAGGREYRSYLIFHRAERSNGKARKPARWAYRAIKHPGSLPFFREDLRDPEQAGWVRDYLEALPMDIINRILADGHEL